MKRFLALLCAAWMLVGIAAAENTLILPPDLTVIGEEAFMDAASLRRVVVPKGMKEIREKAFAGSSVRAMNLPESIDHIAEDAFDGCEKLTVSVPRDSYAHHYASDQDLRYTIIEPETDADGEDAGYAINYVECITEIYENLPRPYRYFLIDADMPEFCDVEVRFYDEEDPNGEPVQYCCEDVDESDIRDGRILFVLPYEEYFPDYFILDVRLIRRQDQKQLGETYVTYEYTKRHAEIKDKTQADYEEQEVISYGDAGYAVLSEGVIRAEGTKVSGGYTLTPLRELKKGDVLYLDLGDKNKAVKVESFEENGDGTVTVTPDEDICLADVFAHLDISGYMQPVSDSGFISPGASAADATFIPMSPSFKLGPVTVGGTAGVSVKMDIKHDKEADYFSAECWIESIADLEIKLTGGINSRDWEDDPFEIPLCPPTGLKIPKTDVEAMLTVTIPLNFELEAGGSVFVNVRNKVGFSYNSDDEQFNKIKDKEAKAYAEVVGKVSLDAGPQVKLEAELLEMLDAAIWGQVGVKATGELEGLQYGGSVSDENPASKHACLGCLNCDIHLFAGVYGKLEGEISEKIKFDLLDEPIFEVSGKIGDAYWSFLNEEESIYGGKASSGFTECKNHQYRTDFSTLDYKEDEVAGIAIVCAGEQGSAKTGKSPYSLYLYPGSYTALAAFKLGDVSAPFVVKDKARSVVLKEEAVSIEGDVRDVDTYQAIPGAQVALTLPDGSVLSRTTDALGEFSFDGLPAGVYSITASAQEYKPYTYDGKECAQGGSYGVHITLVKGRVSIEGFVSDGDTGEAIGGATVTALLPDGSRRTTTADARGKYRFDDLPAGVYAVTAQAEGYLSKTYSDLTYKGNSENTLNLALNMDWPDAKIVKQIVESMSGDLISRMKEAGIGVNPSFSFYRSASGGNTLSYTLRWDMDYSKYEANEELFKEALIAIVDSGIFPLTEDEAADLKSRIQRSVTYKFDVELDNGFSTWGGVPINSLIVELRFDPRSSSQSYTRVWNSAWKWDELNYRNIY